MLRFLGGTTDDDGGRIAFDGGDSTIAFSMARTGEAPRWLEDGPVVGWIEDTGDTTGESVRDETEFPTLAHALLDMYGPEEGCAIPAPMEPAVRLARGDEAVAGQYEARALDRMAESARCAATYVGARPEHTGGNCVALRCDHDDGTFLRIVGEGGTFPTSLVEPVTVAFYGDEGDVDPSTWTESTLAHALVEIYGPFDGPVPYPLRAAAHVVYHLDEGGDR
ncbi:MAG: hypothetical protein ACODAA_00850 [Gemmatimonadota bacterium]